MSKIPLTSGYSLPPEGIQTFLITDVTYKEQFGKLEIQMETASGVKHTERFSLLTSKGDVSDGAYAAFSMLAKAAMNDYDLEEIDHKDLIGRYFQAEVVYDEVESNKTPGKMLKFARLNDKQPADGFPEGTVRKASSVAPSKPKAAAKPKVDLGSLLD